MSGSRDVARLLVLAFRWEVGRTFVLRRAARTADQPRGSADGPRGTGLASARSAAGRVMGTPTAQETVRLLVETWNTGEVDGLRGRGADQVTFHYRGATFPTDLDGLAGLVAQWREAFPDLTMRQHETVAAGDLVAVRLTFSGTHRGTWQGHPPTGRRIDVEEMLLLRFERDLLVEVWEVQDELSLLEQIGAVPAGGAT